MKRRQPQRLQQKFKEAVWPTMGYRRAFSYWRHRVFRQGHSTYKIAGGFATGAAVSVTPFLGTHIMQMLFICWLLDLNIIAAFFGTAIGNPWTYPFIFWFIYKTGVTVCGLFGLGHFIAMPDDMALSHFMDEPLVFLKYLFAHPQKLLLPLTIGGYLTGLAIWPVAFGIFYYPVRKLRIAYRQQRERFRLRHPKNRAKP